MGLSYLREEEKKSEKGKGRERSEKGSRDWTEDHELEGGFMEKRSEKGSCS